MLKPGYFFESSLEGGGREGLPIISLEGYRNTFFQAFHLKAKKQMQSFRKRNHL